MFKIGDFSKVCQVSIKTLRHWDHVDLLKPAHIDAFTNYRYYDITQLTTVNRILAYKGLGLSLKEIKRLLDDQPSTSEIRGMLKLKQAELRQQLDDRQRMLLQVENRLALIEQEGQLPEEETVLKPVAEQHVATIRQHNETMNDLVRLLYHADQARQQRDNDAIGPLQAVFHDAAYQDEQVEVEVVFPVDAQREAPITLQDDLHMQVGVLPALPQVASTIHTGPWYRLADGYTRLGQWIADNGYTITGVGREIFHQITWKDRITAITEIQFPVEAQA